MSKPSILFLDEPTSGRPPRSRWHLRRTLPKVPAVSLRTGLDASSSLHLIKALRSIASQGLTVAAVLHQPRYEMFCLFHDVLLLGKGGYTVYLGPAVKAKEYL